MRPVRLRLHGHIDFDARVPCEAFTGWRRRGGQVPRTSLLCTGKPVHSTVCTWHCPSPRPSAKPMQVTSAAFRTMARLCRAAGSGWPPYPEPNPTSSDRLKAKDFARLGRRSDLEVELPGDADGARDQHL